VHNPNTVHGTCAKANTKPEGTLSNLKRPEVKAPESGISGAQQLPPF
jgi:hypothetical protein